MDNLAKLKGKGRQNQNSESFIILLFGDDFFGQPSVYHFQRL